jgi:hypothetical protein
MIFMIFQNRLAIGCHVRDVCGVETTGVVEDMVEPEGDVSFMIFRKVSRYCGYCVLELVIWYIRLAIAYIPFGVRQLFRRSLFLL